MFWLLKWPGHSPLTHECTAVWGNRALIWHLERASVVDTKTSGRNFGMVTKMMMAMMMAMAMMMMMAVSTEVVLSKEDPAD